MLGLEDVSIFIGAAFILLGLFVIFRNYKSRLNQSFFFFILSSALWIISDYATDKAATLPAAIFWSKSSFIGPILIPASFYIFTHFFPYRDRRFSTKRFFLVLLLPIILLAFCPTNAFVANIYFDKGDLLGANIKFDPGYLYNLFAVYFVFYMALGFVKIIKNYRQLSGVHKLQISYLFFGTFLSAIIAVFTNIILPFAWHVDSFTKVGPAAAILLITFTSYSIVKHKLLEIKLVVLRTITYSLTVFFISALVVVSTIFIPQQVDDKAFQIFVAIAVSIFLVITLEPLKRGVAKLTDKIFFKANIDYKKTSQQLANIVNKEIDLEALIREIDHQLIGALKLENARIILPNTSGSTYLPLHHSEREYYLDTSSNLVKYLKKEKRIVVLDALERRIEDTKELDVRIELEKSKADINKMNAAVVAPIVTDDRLAAILILGNKKSGDNFSQDDINLFELLGPQLASAIEKSRLYDQIRRFNVKLQKEIAIATEGLRKANEDLQDRNRFLTSIQAVTQLITRSLDFKTVTQAIVDSISTQMGFIGGVLLFYGEDRHKLFPEAITRVRYTDAISKLLPKPIKEYHLDVRRDSTKLVQAVMTGDIQKGDKFSEFVCPPVPTVVASGIQQLVHGRSFVAVPIHSENEIVGCIVFLLEETLDEINQNDINMMNSLADQTGIIYRNLELVQKLRRTNDELEEANEHLKQLDKAKSEFVSIASHQLRTPMTGIMGYLSMITSGDFGKVPKQLNGILGQLLDASQKMIQLINLFLDVSKIESGKLVLSRGPHKIEEIIDRAIQVIGKIAADKGLKLEFVRPAKPIPTLQIDDKIFDVVSNLIDNAIKYTEKGSITVMAEKIDDHVKVTVKDTGRGIPPEEAKNLFNKFVRGYGIAQVNPDGSGLGLYVARRLTEAHGGRIWVESKGKGKGSSFMFTLPLRPPTADEEST